MVIFIVYCLLLAVYLCFENKKNFKIATALKMCLSSIFTVVAWIGAFLFVTPDSPEFLPAVLMSAGLTVAIAGDYFLQYIRLDAKKFKAGILFFGGTQIFLLTAFYWLAPVAGIEFAILAGYLVIALILMKTQKWDTSEQNPQITIYTFLVAFMASKALSMPFYDPRYWSVAVGGTLFFLSDMILGIWNYRSNKMVLADLNWVTYFLGQIALAFTLWML